MPEQLLAEQSEELRLFHEPSNAAQTDASLTNLSQSQVKLSDFWQPKNQQAAHGSVPKAPDIDVLLADKPGVDKLNTEKEPAFQYNGFIATASGRHYLINGVSVSDIESLVFVSAKHGGRSIVLKTPNGQAFELSVGQSISKDSL